MTSGGHTSVTEVEGGGAGQVGPRLLRWAAGRGSEELGRSGPGCGLLKLNCDRELRGRQQTSSVGLKVATGRKGRKK
jgi:hypothetical protein